MRSFTRRTLLQFLGIGSAAAMLPHARSARPADDAPSDEPQEESVSRATRLESFLRSQGIKPAHLAREAGYSRQHLLRVRMGRMLPSLPCIAALIVAARRLTRTGVTALDLFERNVITTAITCCDTRALDEHDREEIIAAFGRGVRRLQREEQ